MVDVIGMSMILLTVLLISLKDFMIQKEKASCKIKSNHILVKG